MPRRSHQTESLLKPVEGIGGGERHAVVGADGGGQAEILEDALEDGEGVALLRRRQGLALQQIAAGKVGDGERVAVAAIGEHELALVIRAPQGIGLVGPAERRALRPRAAAAAARDQAVAVEHGVDGADGGAAHPGPAPPEPLANLRRAPAGILPLERHNQFLDRHRELIGVPVRPPAPVGQPLDAAVFIALVDLVAGLAGDPELRAQRRHLLPVEPTGDEPDGRWLLRQWRDVLHGRPGPLRRRPDVATALAAVVIHRRVLARFVQEAWRGLIARGQGGVGTRAGA